MAMGGRRLAVSLAVLALCADAKVTSGRTRLSSEESERFIDKFSFSRRELGKISGKFTAVGGERYSDGHRHQLQLALFSDLDWAKYQASLRGGSLCSDFVPPPRCGDLLAARPVSVGTLRDTRRFSRRVARR